VSDDSHRARQPVFLRSAVQLLEESAALDLSGPVGGIDSDFSHPRQVDDHAAVARREARDTVPTAADRDDEIVLAREAHRRDDVLDTPAARDDRWIPVGDRVPHRTRAVVLSVARKDQLALECVPQLSERGHVHRLHQ
jgi:hypothetical protein